MHKLLSPSLLLGYNLSSIQVAIQILSLWMIFLLISGTKVFQVGLLSVLVLRFKNMAWVLVTYFLLTLALTIYRVFLLSTNVQFVDLYKYEGKLWNLLCIFSKSCREAARLISHFYYYANIKLNKSSSCIYSGVGFYALSVIQKLVAPFYYVFFMRGLVDVGDPLFYNLNKWVTPFAGAGEVQV
jgi:hypothetical protein